MIIVKRRNVRMGIPHTGCLRLCPTGFCSISKVARVQCEQESMFCCIAEIVLNRFQCEQKPLPVIQCATLPFDLKRSFTKTLTRFRCNFCSDKSVQTSLRPFQKPIQYGMLSTAKQSSTVPEQKLLRKEPVPSVSRSPIQYTFCNAPFHYLVQCPNYVYKINLVPGGWRNTLHKMYIRDIQDLGSSQIDCLRALP